MCWFDGVWSRKYGSLHLKSRCLRKCMKEMSLKDEGMRAFPCMNISYRWKDAQLQPSTFPSHRLWGAQWRTWKSGEGCAIDKFISITNPWTGACHAHLGQKTLLEILLVWWLPVMITRIPWTGYGTVVWWLPVMITRIPWTGYGTVEQRENPPETKVSHKKRGGDVFYVFPRSRCSTVPYHVHGILVINPKPPETKVSHKKRAGDVFYALPRSLCSTVPYPVQRNPGNQP
jgi:hypothetical protein